MPSETYLHRLELKYLVDRSRRTALLRDLRRLMRPDVHAGPSGTYCVRSLYFDTPDFKCYHDKLAGLPIRHKVRARFYGNGFGPNACVRIEVKSRYYEWTRKTTLDVPQADFLRWESSWACNRPASLDCDLPLGRELVRLQRQYCLHPKIVIQYRRQALERWELDRVRANFDDEVWAAWQPALSQPMAAARRVLPMMYSVFEIKLDGFLPRWLHTLIAKYDLQQSAISKYCLAVRCGARLSIVPRAGEELLSPVSAAQWQLDWAAAAPRLEGGAD
jgi:hypothetical protein